MKRILYFIATAFITTTGIFADTPTNKAVGYDANLNGLSVRYLTSSGLGVQGIIGMVITSGKDVSGSSVSGMNLNIGADLYKAIWKADKANLNGFVGFEVMTTKPIIKNADTQTNFAIVVGGEPEIFLISNLSVSTKFGVSVQINGESLDAFGNKVKNSGTTVFDTFGNRISIVDGVSFHWYF